MQYTDELFKACGVAIICLIVILSVGHISHGVGVAVRIGGIIVIFGIVLSLTKDNINGLEDIISSKELSGTMYVSRAFSLMSKGLGISLTSKICSDVCRDAGESGIANAVDYVGRAVILSMCIPVISEILGYASEIMSRT